MSKIVTINLNIDESIIPFFLGRFILNNYGCALVGISLGNSYFKEDILITFFEKIKHMFCHIYIFIPTLPYIHTLRAKAKEGIGRGLFCYTKGRQIHILYAFIKKSQKTPKEVIQIARLRMKEVN